MCDYIYHDKASSIKTGGYLLLKGSPCKVVEVHKSKTGKHGNAKMRFVGIDIYTRKKYEDWFPGAESVEIPEVKKYDIRVTKVDDKSVSGTTLKGETKTFPLPTGRQESLEELSENIKQRYKNRQPTLVTIACSIGKEAIISVRGGGAGGARDRSDSESDE